MYQDLKAAEEQFFFAGGCYCTRGRRWHIAKEAELQLVDIMQSIILEVQPKVARIQGIIVQQRLARSLHIGLAVRA